MNLLKDPVFRVQTPGGLEFLSLPALLASLGRNEVDHFVGLQRHQVDAFHVFLTYLAGAVLARSRLDQPRQDGQFWKKGLLTLAGGGGGDAWELVGEDFTRPAFMQPPLPKTVGKATSVVTTPDELDVLQTAKNHDVKRTRAAFPALDTWVYSLISVQTMSGFSGRGNQGISRMNSGFGNRAIVELISDGRPGQKWMDAVVRLLEHRDTVLKGSFGYDPQGLVLVWVEPWDGATSLPLKNLDPFYIEICRRVRLVGEEGGIKHAQLYAASRPRIAAKELKGVVGDPWLPVDLTGIKTGQSSDLKALTFPAAGITADHMRRLVFGQEVKLSALQKPLPGWRGELRLSVSVLVRGQGITDGFYEWNVLIPEEKVPSVFGGFLGASLEALSREAIEKAALMQNRVLKPAVFAHILGAPDRLRLDDDFASAIWVGIVRRFETLWSAEYFPWLFSVPEEFSEDEEISRWVKILQDHALLILQGVERSLPCHSGRQYRVRTQVRNRFWGALYRHFEFLRRGRVEGEQVGND